MNYSFAMSFPTAVDNSIILSATRYLILQLSSSANFLINGTTIEFFFAAGRTLAR